MNLPKARTNKGQTKEAKSQTGARGDDIKLREVTGLLTRVLMKSIQCSFINSSLLDNRMRSFTEVWRVRSIQSPVTVDSSNHAARLHDGGLEEKSGQNYG